MKLGTLPRSTYQYVSYPRYLYSADLKSLVRLKQWPLKNDEIKTYKLSKERQTAKGFYKIYIFVYAGNICTSSFWDMLA